MIEDLRSSATCPDTEKRMIKIGDFSKLSRVSVKALRYYDEIGLLRPEHVDRWTEYRYYSIDQLPRLNRILALKDLGLSLDQIARLLDGDLPPAQIRGMLRLKQAEIHQRLEEDQARLARVEARLRQIEQEDAMLIYEVVLKKVDPQWVAAVHRVIPTYGDVRQLLSEVLAHLARHQVKPAGPPVAIYYDTEYREQDVNVEAGFPVAASTPGGEHVAVRQLPGMDLAACVVYQGTYSTIGDAYTTLMQWIEANGYRIAGPNREIYLRGPESGPIVSSYMTEVQFPVEKA